MCRWRLAGGSSPSLGTGEPQQEGQGTHAPGKDWSQGGGEWELKQGVALLPCPGAVWREGGGLLVTNLHAGHGATSAEGGLCTGVSSGG